VRVSFSRRTPEKVFCLCICGLQFLISKHSTFFIFLKVSRIIVKELGDHPKVLIWDGEGSNHNSF